MNEKDIEKGIGALIGITGLVFATIWFGWKMLLVLFLFWWAMSIFNDADDNDEPSLF